MEYLYCGFILSCFFISGDRARVLFSATDTTCMFLIIVIKGGLAHLDFLSFCIGAGMVEDTHGER